MDKTSFSNGKNHFDSLDGLRGLAVLLVVFSHTFYYLVLPVFGWIGVDLFFALSGFLITRILLSAKNEKHFFKHFYIRRILRIFPLYYFVIGLMFLAEIFISLPRDFTFSSHFIYYLTYTQNLLLFIRNQAPEPHLILGHFWSLSVEEHFYLLWPIVVYWCNIRKLLITSIVIIVFSKLVSIFLLHNNFSWLAIYSFSFCRIESLAIGGILATLYYVNWPLLKAFCKYTFILAAFLLTAIYGGGFYTKGWDVLGPAFAAENYGSLIFTILALFFASLLFLVLEVPALRTFFSSKWLTQTGKYSYGIYIFHYPVFVFTTNWLIPNVSDELYQDLPVKLLVSVLSIVATFILAFCSFQLLEKPFLNMKSKFPMNTKR